ncbi:MAG: leucine-rich repeat domain-containing protein [Bacteroidales bacterium]|nr:leucine-rich repeat domain-containing protein [Bacteroidales bacterium]
MKRLLLLICTLLCANVLSAQTTFWIGDIQYEITSTNPAEVEVNNATSAITTANIPSTVTYQETTYDVTAIGDSAFYDCRSLTTVTIPNSVTYIGDRAFKSCSSLTSVTIGNSVTSIGGAAFSGCSSLTSVTIGNSVTSIGDDAFNSCSSLTSVTIPNSITSIGYYAFAFCSALTSVTIPNSVVTSIGDRAFYGCSSLTSMTIDMTYIPNLSNIGLNSTLQNLTLGENVTSIRSGAFNNYFFLQNVTCLATTPPTLADNTVFPYPNIATLTVPCGTLEAYSSATSFWNMFFNGRIEEDCEDDTGLEDAEETLLSFFPNPTKSEITFNQAIEKVEVIDLTGKAILTFTNAKTINIESLPAGTYYLRLTNEEKTSLQKVIKQ